MTATYQLRVSINGGAWQTGGVTAAAGDTVDLSVASGVGITAYRWEIYDYPVGFACPAGWTDVSGVYRSTASSPQQFTLDPTLWAKYGLRLTVNGGMRDYVVGTTTYRRADPLLIDEATALSVPDAGSGLVGLLSRETSQFFADWTDSLNADLHLIAAAFGPLLAGGLAGTVLAGDGLGNPPVYTPDPTVDTLTANEHVRAVADNIIADRGLQSYQYSADAQAAAISGFKARGTPGVPGIVQNSDQLLRFDAYVWDSSGSWYAAHTAFSYVADVSPAIGDVGVGLAEYFDAGAGDGYEIRRNYYPVGSDKFQFDIHKSNLALIGDGLSAAFQNYRCSADANPAAFNGFKSRGSYSSPAIVSNSDQSWRAQAYFHDGNSWHLGGTVYFYVSDASPADDDIGTGWRLEADEGNGGGSAVRFDLHPDGTSFLWDHKDTRHTGDSDTFTIEDAISISGGESKTLPSLHFDTADDGSTYTCAALTVDTNGWCGEIHLTWDAIGGTTAGESASWRRFSKIAINDGLASIVAADDATALGNDNNDAGFIGNFATNLATSGGGIYTIGLDFDGSGVQVISWGVETDVRSFLKAI